MYNDNDNGYIRQQLRSMVLDMYNMVCNIYHKPAKIGLYPKNHTQQQWRKNVEYKYQFL